MRNRYSAEITRVVQALRSTYEDLLDPQLTVSGLLSLYDQSEVLRAKLLRMHEEIGQAWDEIEVLCEAGVLEARRARSPTVDGEAASVDAVRAAVARWAA